MPKLRRLSGREVCSILKQQGFAPVRQRGSHIIMRRSLPGNDSRTVPVPDHKELDTGTLSGIIRQSGLDRSLFMTG